MVSSRKLMIISGLIFLVWVGVGILMYTSPSMKLPSDDQNLIMSEEVVKCKTYGQKLSPDFWKHVDLQRDIPSSVNKTVPQIAVHSDFATIQNTKIHYLYAVHPNPAMKKDVSVLLLHGQAFTSDIWRKLNTIQNIAAFGFHPVAIDLPKYGKSPAIENLNRGEFLDSVIKTLNLKNPVIISPSMSGSFSLPYLLEHSDKLAGFVPVAPVGINILDKSSCKNGENVYKTSLSEDCERIKGYLKKQPPDLSCIKVPTLVVFGEKDRGENSAKLCFLPNSQGAEIPNGSHTAYKSDPELWHKLLYNFLSVINETLKCK
ncbi:putative protein-lysine deacylase ABHD14B [Parasteatoda tepidariorum]|uniref:putative protein-lysine deacylase ABHD14B n=1 Tax=Parasteatoda tepidariorum TaxID=114398 RepID=UPI00077FA83B|nr:protein ABHD14B [Parasteatoda tepidariorum]